MQGRENVGFIAQLAASAAPEELMNSKDFFDFTASLYDEFLSERRNEYNLKTEIREEFMAA